MERTSITSFPLVSSLSSSSSPFSFTAEDIHNVSDDVTLCPGWEKVSQDVEGEVGKMVKELEGRVKKGVSPRRRGREEEGEEGEGWGLYELKLVEVEKGEKREEGGGVEPYSTRFLVERERVRQTEAMILNRVTHWGVQSKQRFLIFSFPFFFFFFS